MGDGESGTMGVEEMNRILKAGEGGVVDMDLEKVLPKKVEGDQRSSDERIAELEKANAGLIKDLQETRVDKRTAEGRSRDYDARLSTLEQEKANAPREDDGDSVTKAELRGELELRDIHLRFLTSERNALRQHKDYDEVTMAFQEDISKAKQEEIMSTRDPAEAFYQEALALKGKTDALEEARKEARKELLDALKEKNALEGTLGAEGSGGGGEIEGSKGMPTNIDEVLADAEEWNKLPQAVRDAALGKA